MRFEWDGTKAMRNALRHGVTFEEALTVFYDPMAATFPDILHSVDEPRWVTVGVAVSGRLLVVCHTERHGSERIISARLATRSERKRHEE